MRNIVEIYCFVDNVVKLFESENKVGRKKMLTTTDYIVLAIMKNQLGFSTVKEFYNFAVTYLKKDFPKFPSYQQFNEGINLTFRYFTLITLLLTKINRKKGARIHIIDSTPLPVCRNQHRFLEKVFSGFAKPGKNMNGWYWGFKLHIIIDANMEIEAIRISDGSTKDLSVLEGDFIKGIKGWLVGDKGYIGKKKAEELSKKGIKLLTRSRKNMKKIPALPIHNKLLSRRQTVETVFSVLKHRLHMINKFARSPEGFFVSLFSAVVSYIFKRKKKTFYLKEIHALSIS